MAAFGGPGDAVVLVEGQTFVLSDRCGDITPDLPHGLFVLDRRILSRWELQVNGYRVEPLAVAVREPFTATFAGRGHAARGYADADLVVFRHRHVGGGLRDRIVVTNHGLVPVTILVELFCDVDFADLFAVKEARVQAGRPRTMTLDARALRYESDERQVARTSTIGLAGGVAVEPGVASWRATLEPGATWQTCVDVVSSVEGKPIEPRFTCDGDDTVALPTQCLDRWRATVPRVETDHAPFEHAPRRAGEDLGALRIFDPEHPDRPIIAAGAPWFMTVFGRDSMLTGFMAFRRSHARAWGARGARPLPGRRCRRPQRGGARQDPPRDALRDLRVHDARRRRRLLRLDRCHAAVRHAVRRAVPVGPGQRARRRAPAPRRSGDRAVSSATATSTTPTG